MLEQIAGAQVRVDGGPPLLERRVCVARGTQQTAVARVPGQSLLRDVERAVRVAARQLLVRRRAKRGAARRRAGTNRVIQRMRLRDVAAHAKERGQLERRALSGWRATTGRARRLDGRVEGRATVQRGGAKPEERR